MHRYLQVHPVSHQFDREGFDKGRDAFARALIDELKRWGPRPVGKRRNQCGTGTGRGRSAAASGLPGVREARHSRRLQRREGEHVLPQEGGLGWLVLADQ
jgi:hypothetical protein